MFSAWILYLTILFSILFVINNSQTYYSLGKGINCTGKGSINIKNHDYEIPFNIRGVYSSTGWTRSGSDYQSGNHTYHFTLCGKLTNTTCPGDWCFEEVNKTVNSKCINGIAKWEENDHSNINYFAIYNSSQWNVDASTYTSLGAHISISNIGETGPINCLNNISIINYNLRCENTTTTLRGLSENYTHCVWNVTYASSYGCLVATLIPASSSKTQISAGSIILIAIAGIAVSYIVLGWLYNRCCNGKTGSDACPNKESWTLCCRYVKAGCEATRDTLCCCCQPQPESEFQHL